LIAFSIEFVHLSIQYISTTAGGTASIIDRLGPDILFRIIKEAGAYEYGQLVCKAWRTTVSGYDFHLATTLVEVHGSQEALMRAVKSKQPNRDAVVRQLLTWPVDAPRADWLDGEPLHAAAEAGCTAWSQRRGTTPPLLA
jgi:hypothetical protein